MSLLDLQPYQVTKDLNSYSSFIYGVPKVGKSTFVHELYGQDVLFIATENRYKALAGAYIKKVNNWASYLSILAELNNPAVKEKFKVICIDTVDNLYKLCDKYVAQIYKEQHVGEKKIAWGADWVRLGQEWEKGVTLIEKMGYTPCFVGHAITKIEKIPVEAILAENVMDTMELVEMEEEDEQGNKVTKRYYEFEKYYPDLRDKIFAPLNNMVDNILFMAESIDSNGKACRVIHLRETMAYKAGCTFRNVKPTIPLDVDEYRSTIENAIEGIDNELLTEDKAEPFIEPETATFEQIKAECVELCKAFGKEHGRAELTKIIEKTLGEGKLLSDCTEEQQELVQKISNDIKEKM